MTEKKGTDKKKARKSWAWDIADVMQVLGELSWGVSLSLVALWRSVTKQDDWVWNSVHFSEDNRKMRERECFSKAVYKHAIQAQNRRDEVG